ncbi:MAG: BT4734/BF3469 family protein [Candidatus Cloacimonadota bacterium]|nr:BT4734/BF3469 family protein [Candidatus Cloacimonadota bacterium]
MDSILNIEISCFKDCLTPSEPVNINLLQWLTSKKHAAKVEQIRNIANKKERNELKKKLPAITPSGLFSYRKADSLIKHSGFMQIDIDFADNTHITNYNNLKTELSKIKNIAYLGLSVSGTGYWGLIPIAHPEKHAEHFEALSKQLKQYGLIIDQSCKDVSRLRIYSYDDEAYFNHEAEPFKIIETPSRKTDNAINQKIITKKRNDNINLFDYCINEIKTKGIDICPGYAEWFAVGCALANEFGETGRNYFHIISNQYLGKHTINPDKQYNDCLKHSYSYDIATFFYYCDQSNIKYKSCLHTQQPTYVNEIKSYWKGFPNALKEFKEVPKKRESYFKEFLSENQSLKINYQSFVNQSFKL